jgi:enhancing lycopene biosynthesis protein 2
MGMKRFAVVLSGCGVFDGSEIQESVLTMLAVRKLGAEYAVFAPDVPQMHVLNHLTGEVGAEKRNVLVESARIARGKIAPLSEFRADLFDAIILPGGFGAAKNLSTYAVAGVGLEVNSEVACAVSAMLEAHKPVGALCIAPVILAKMIPGVKITLGAPGEDSEAAEAMGACVISAQPTGAVVDELHNVFTGPCYMYDATIEQVAECAENVVRAMLCACGG